MTILKKTIIATNLDQVLSSTGPYTFFAPSDVAFAKIETNKLDNLLNPKNCGELTELLNLHLIEGKINFRDLEDGQELATVSGKVLSVEVKNGTVKINSATIQHHDLKASNGVLHCLDTVID